MFKCMYDCKKCKNYKKEIERTPHWGIENNTCKNKEIAAVYRPEQLKDEIYCKNYEENKDE